VICEIHGVACGAEKFPEHELRTDAAEYSPIYSGFVLSNAIRIVCFRKRLTTSVLSRRLGIPKNTFYRYRRATPCRRITTFNQMIMQLAIFGTEWEQ